MIELTDARIHKYLTPYKYPEPVLHGSGQEGAFDQKAVDIPFVFEHKGQFHMLYTGFDGIGYQSALAVSDDLLHWRHKGVILKRDLESGRWDRIGGAVTWMIKESDYLYDMPRLRKVDGKYWLVYHSYPGTGYESGPAEIGLAWTEDEELLEWNFPEKPVFSWKDGEDWEAGGLYKACIIEDKGTWYLFYNAKNKEERWTEQTGAATSRDLLHWTRCPENPLLRVNRESWDRLFVSDPYIVRDGDTWVNFYFGYGKIYEDGHTHAQEGLALSGDLIHWEKVREPIIPYGGPGEIDAGHAHKASIVYHDGVLYHFYCATRPSKEGDATEAYGEYRTICLAASKPVWEKSHILPFLWMKGEDNDTIREELDRIEECGIREVCLESRPHPDFCGPGWWENLDFIIEEARRRGMRIWILDDDKFPTGHANGGFERQQQKKKLYLGERHMDICGPCRSGAVLVENFVPSDGRLLGILACPKPDGETLAVSGEGILDLTDKLENGFVYFDLPEGAYRLFVLFTTHKGGGRDNYMNLIDGESVRVLLEEVYEKHYKRYARYFGNVIAGFFSDEPELGNVPGYPFDATLGQKDVRLPWSGELEEALRGEWGEDFLLSLPALWYESGGRTVSVRSAYMDCLTRLVKTCFSGQVGKWCSDHDVEYIGHIIEDDNAHARLGCSIGHYFREMEGQHMAGIDVVHHQVVPGFTEPVHQWIAGDRDGEFFHFGLGKLGSSAAHIDPAKKNRAMCEIFGNYGWAEGNSLMKWLTDHMLVRGINEFTPHAFAMSYPDPDCPPHFYARGNHPGFSCFAQLMKYMNRAAHFLSGGVHLADAAILYHAESEWSGGKTMYFHKPGRKLMERQLDYDVIPADILKDGSAGVESGRLVINQESYPCLILPYAEYLDRGVAEFVIKHGSGELPVFVIDGLPAADTQGKALPEGFAGAVSVVRLEDIPEAVKAAGDPSVLEAVNGHSGLRSFTLRKEKGFAVMYFNESTTQKAAFDVLVKDPAFRAYTIYDPWTRSAEESMIEGEAEKEYGRIPLVLEPGEAVFLRLEEGRRTDRHRMARESARTLSLDWRVSKKGELETAFTGDILLPAGEPLPNLNGPGYDPAFTGTYRYEGGFTFRKEEGRRYWLLLPEASDSVRLILNGTDLGWLAGFPARREVTECLAEGKNELVIEVTTTLVWKRRDGASTHLQIPASGMTRPPVLETYRGISAM